MTLLGLAATPGETVNAPGSGRSRDGYQTRVLYADSDRVMLKYTPDDNVVTGYMIHIEGFAVEPNLIALYQALNKSGRHDLPAVRAGQMVGRARANKVKVAVRDNGSFMDPRSRKDWWIGR